jgi:hypothetical protein
MLYVYKCGDSALIKANLVVSYNLNKKVSN